jgi:hypothetical protein
MKVKTKVSKENETAYLLFLFFHDSLFFNQMISSEHAMRKRKERMLKMRILIMV